MMRFLFLFFKVERNGKVKYDGPLCSVKNQHIRVQSCPCFRPKPGLMNSQHTPPINAMPAARPRATGQPYESASQGVNVGERFSPIFSGVHQAVGFLAEVYFSKFF